MRATSLLLGCLLSLGAIANATAAGTIATGGGGSGSSASENCTSHAADHSTASHDNSSGNSGDAFNLPHGTSAASSATHNRAAAAGSSSDDNSVHMSGGDGDGSSHGSGLSWQSLLPGSIQ